jgi:hypothetical protein
MLASGREAAMQFTELKIDPQAARERAAELAANLKANKGLSDFRGFAVGVVAWRLQRDPMDYRRYGPYWWALKGLLIDSGRLLEGDFDVMVASEYCGDTDEETLAMAEMFRDEQMATVIGGSTDHFQLSADPAEPAYILFDADMERRNPT